MGSSLGFGLWFAWVSPWLALAQPPRERELHQKDPACTSPKTPSTT